MANQIILPHDFATITRNNAVIINGNPAISFIWLADNYNEIRDKYNAAIEEYDYLLIYGVSDPSFSCPVSKSLYINTTTNIIFRWDPIANVWRSVSGDTVGGFPHRSLLLLIVLLFPVVIVRLILVGLMRGYLLVRRMRGLHLLRWYVFIILHIIILNIIIVLMTNGCHSVTKFRFSFYVSRVVVVVEVLLPVM